MKIAVSIILLAVKHTQLLKDIIWDHVFLQSVWDVVCIAP